MRGRKDEWEGENLPWRFENHYEKVERRGRGGERERGGEGRWRGSAQMYHWVLVPKLAGHKRGCGLNGLRVSIDTHVKQNGFIPHWCHCILHHHCSSAFGPNRHHTVGICRDDGNI